MMPNLKRIGMVVIKKLKFVQSLTDNEVTWVNQKKRSVTTIHCSTSEQYQHMGTG